MTTEAPRIMEELIESLKTHKSNIENFFQSKFIYFSGTINQKNSDTYFCLLRKIKTHPPTNPKEKVCIIMNTEGGDISVVKNMMANTNSHFDVLYIVPSIALSAGTFFSLTSHKLFMNSNSQLGALDIQFCNDDENSYSYNECVNFVINYTVKEDLIKFIDEYKILCPSPIAEYDYCQILDKLKTFPIERIKVEALRKMCEAQSLLNDDIEYFLNCRWENKIIPTQFNIEEGSISNKKIARNFSDYIFLGQEGLNINAHSDGINIEKLKTYFGLQIENYEELDLASDINCFHKLISENLGYINENILAFDELHIILGCDE